MRKERQGSFDCYGHGSWRQVVSGHVRCRHNRSLSCPPSPLMACPCCLVPLVARHVGVRCSESFRTITPRLSCFRRRGRSHPLSPLRLNESPFFHQQQHAKLRPAKHQKGTEFDDSIRVRRFNTRNLQTVLENSHCK